MPHPDDAEPKGKIETEAWGARGYGSVARYTVPIREYASILWGTLVVSEDFSSGLLMVKIDTSEMQRE